MGAEAHLWMMTAPNTAMVDSPFNPFPPQAAEVVIENAGCGVCHTGLGYFLRRRAHQSRPAAYAGPRDQRARRHPLRTPDARLSNRTVQDGRQRRAATRCRDYIRFDSSTPERDRLSTCSTL